MALPPWMIPPERLGPEMRRVYQEGVRAVKDGAKILIRGEDGVGKKVMARWLHEASPRADRPMVALSVPGTPVALMDEHLFGNRLPGAGTPEGALERAHGSTLMLELIEHIERKPLQKLRAAIDAGAVLPAGATAPVRADFQLFMTSEPLPRPGTEKSWYSLESRELADVELEIPPLRERRSDIRPLAEQIANNQRTTEGRPPVSFAPGTMELLEDFGWPSNVLELMMVVRSAAMLSPGSEIRTELLLPLGRTTRR
jgi:DNA-binding NtrC family response regulator